ncbi:hypothetical protein D6C85_01657 [Aureobasidium pullulans]|uniref:Uncharacterized protein n=1 Tax=Aureobasidium pullulans TaxID=5580 RepID=A0A4V4KZJ0_AURPU|nr:hypothetical protein D6C85_01657 [Aureobasidium pullulans]
MPKSSIIATTSNKLRLRIGWQLIAQNTGRSRPDLKIIAQELILLALGHRSPASYQRTVQDSTVTEAGLTLVTEEVEGLKTSDSTWRCREFAYYKWLQELRVAGCEYVDLAQVKRTRTVFAQFQGPKTRAHVLEWAKFFKPFAGLLAKRALGDHTGKAEHGIISRDARGFQPINEWHNYNSFWRSVGDSARFNTTHVQLDRGWLPRANIQLEHGFEGVASENAVWSIWPTWIEGALVLCASVHLPAHSFVGILPGRPGFIAEEVPAGVVEGPEPGPYMELGSRVSLLSTISRTKKYAESNVIVTWEPYANEMSSGHTCFHLVLFTYRAIELCQPLVPWDHMTKCHVEGGQISSKYDNGIVLTEIVVESISENNDVIEARLDSDVWMKSLLRGPHSRKFKIIREKQTQYVHAREAQLEDLRKIDGFEEMTFRFCADLRTYIGNQEAIDRLDKINSEFYLGAPYMHQNTASTCDRKEDSTQGTTVLLDLLNLIFAPETLELVHNGLPSSPTSGPGPKPSTAIPEIEVVNLDDESDDSEGQVAPPHAGIEVITLADDSDEGEPTSPLGTLDGNSQNSQSPPRRQQPVPAQRAIFGEESPSRSPSPRRVALAVSRTGSAMSGILHNGSRSSSVVSGSRRGSVMSDVDYHGIFPGSSLFYTGTTPSPTKDEHQHVELVDEDVLGPDDPIPTPPRVLNSVISCAKFCHF